MKIRKSKTVNVIEDYSINYENGITCSAQVINDKLITFQFKNNKLKLDPIENIDEVIDKHWTKHSETAKLIKIKTIEDLKIFNGFDKLFYLGCHHDGMVRDRNGSAIASIIILDVIFCSIFAKIGTPDKVDDAYTKIHQHEWIKKIEKVEIPYYNREKDRTHSLIIEIKPTSEVLNEILTRLKAKYVDDMVKLELLSLIGYKK